MRVEIHFTTDPIPAHLGNLEVSDAIGSLVEFRGIVRGAENGESIAGLRYEAYESMARHQLQLIIHELALKYPCHTVHLIHRTGDIRVGETAIYVAIYSSHRGEGFAMLAQLMERLKVDVPIWKIATL